MPVHYFKEKQIFQIDTANTSMLFCVLNDGHILSQYWGRRINHTDLSRLWNPSPNGFTPQYKDALPGRCALDLLPTEYPVFGGGDFGSPALHVEFSDGSRLLDLRYHSHRMLEDIPESKNLPGLHGANKALEIKLTDAASGLQVILRYMLFHDADCIARSAEIVNATKNPVRILKALSASIDLPEDNYEMIGLYGAHMKERHIERMPLRHGTQLIESRRGASSHQHNPFAALVLPSTTESSGEAYGFSLIYSGNFVISAEVGQHHSTRLQLGINPFDFRWTLAAGESFETPQSVLSYTPNGLNKLSQNFHQVFRQNLGHSSWKNKARPVVINNWEASYFNFDEKKLLEIIEGCKGLGIDMFVLDDGWFGCRDNDTTSLGDWFMDPRKLPNGLTPIIERCEELGMSFGLWFEPEMISEQSELYRNNPDWCIRKDGRPYCLGRNQLILDLSREEIVEYLEQVISKILTENHISYVKWDMNRYMTDAYSCTLSPERQPELAHRYMLNLYGLMDRLTKRFPEVLFEGCSGGGGRFDAGMLYYMPQIWTSDNTDAIERLKIQYGTSLVYPLSSMTAHVSACPNHQIGRTTPFTTRGAVAMSAILGYELNPLTLSEDERAEVAKQIAQYKQIEDLIINGDFYRLISPFETDSCAWAVVSPDKKEAFAVYVRQQTTLHIPNRRMKLQGLDPNARYFIKELDASYYGDEMMYAGILIPRLNDYDARCFTLLKEEL